jgi:hypothetical protein
MMKSYCDPSIDIQKKPHFLLQDFDNRYKDRRNHILLLIKLDDFKGRDREDRNHNILAWMTFKQ